MYIELSLILWWWHSWISNRHKGLGWLNELGSWITKQLIQAYHKYGVGSHPAL